MEEVFQRVVDIHGDSQGAVDARYVYDSHENGAYLNRAINGFGIRTKGVKYKIQTQLDSGGDVKTIDTVSGATWSSEAIYNAFRNAVDNAKAAA